MQSEPKQPYHAGGDTTGTGADHEVSDLLAPELLATSVGQEGQGSLLQLVRGIGIWKGRVVVSSGSPALPPASTSHPPTPTGGHSLLCLVRPQPVVAHIVPAGKSSASSGRHTADTVWEKRAGVASFSRVMSLLMVNMLNLGFLKTCDGTDSHSWGLGRNQPEAGPPLITSVPSLNKGLFSSAAPPWAQEPEAQAQDRGADGPCVEPHTACFLLCPILIGYSSDREKLEFPFTLPPAQGFFWLVGPAQLAWDATPKGLPCLGPPGFWGHHTLAIFSTWMSSASEPWSNSPATTRWEVLERKERILAMR